MVIGSVLERNYPEYLDYKDIMLQTNLNKGSVTRTLRKMKKREEVEYKIIQGDKPRSGWNTIYRMKGGR